MAEGVVESRGQCAFCGTPIIQTDKLVQVGGLIYCCPNCELAARQPELSRRAAKRGGGLVLTCNLCRTPIFLPEIMVVRGQRNYCCLNCAEVARLREQTAASETTAHPMRP